MVAWTRMKAAAFPETRTLDELDRSACSIREPGFNRTSPLGPENEEAGGG